MQLKSVSKSILAQKFGWCLISFVEKINTNEKLYKELKDKAGYNSTQKLFTPKQVKIIYKYLGNPEECI